MLYDFDRRLEKEKTKIEELDNEGNKGIILKFLKQLFAEGISEARVLKYSTHLRLISKFIDFQNATKEDIIEYLSELEQSKYAEHTKHDYKVALKRIFNYLGKNELVKDFRVTMKKNKKRLPDTLTEAEVKRIIEAADHPRDKAMIAVAYEGGLRVGELASLRIRDVGFDKYGAIIRVRGKTGERRIRLVTFSSTIAKWMDMHPRRDEEKAPLWISIANFKKEMTYRGFDKRIKRAAKEAGIKKRVYCHVFRHSRATHLANYLTEAQMDEYFGWVQGSDMPATYVHLSGRDVDNRILEIHNLKPRDEKGENDLKPIICPRCDYINSPISRYCGRCGTVLDEEERIKLEIRSREVSREFPDLSIADTELLDEMKKFRDVLEFFEKHPDLFKRMKAMVEGN
ncbi:MAG: tyrosine-type recombinase/integrase [Theionarchaea archaeon]|nr:tyrosine-type recombinase/integrase [Theionarchaea archaeon]